MSNRYSEYSARHRMLNPRIWSLVSYTFCILLAFLFYSRDTPCRVSTYSNVESERADMVQRANAALEEILEREEFKAKEPKASFWFRQIQRLISYLPAVPGWLSAVLQWLFYPVALIVIFLALIFILKRFRKLPSFKRDHGVTIEPQSRADPELIKIEAHKWSQKGDYRQAIRCLFLSLLLYLDKMGSLTYDPGKTNGQYLREVHKGMANEARNFASLILLFERKWYGMEESSEQDFHQYEESFAKLIGLVNP